MNIVRVLFLLFLGSVLVLFYIMIMYKEYNRHIEQSRKINSFLPSSAKRYKYDPGADSFHTILLRKFVSI